MYRVSKSKLVDLQEVGVQQSRQAALSPGELIAEKLAQLQLFIDQLARTPEGRAELAERTVRFGSCDRGDGESAKQFHGRLRNWLDRNLSH